MEEELVELIADIIYDEAAIKRGYVVNCEGIAKLILGMLKEMGYEITKTPAEVVDELPPAPEA